MNNTTAKEFLFIDANVADKQTLIDGVAKNVKLVELNDKTDALSQIAAALKGQKNLDAIHIISHGSEGELDFSSGAINNSNISTYAAQLKKIGSSLSKDGDILLYGCDVAKGDDGQAFINSLAKATKADVAASDDLTGSAILGGNWDLEKNSGAIKTDSFLFNEYEELLAIPQTINAMQSIFVRPGATSYTWTWLNGMDGVGVLSAIGVRNLPVWNWNLTRGYFQYSSNAGSSWTTYNISTDVQYVSLPGKIWRFIDTASGNSTTTNHIALDYKVGSTPYGTSGMEIFVDNAPTNITSSNNTGVLVSDTPLNSEVATLTPVDTGITTQGKWIIDSQSNAGLFALQSDPLTGNTAKLLLNSSSLPANGTQINVITHYYDLYQTNTSGNPISGQGITKTLTFTVKGSSHDLNFTDDITVDNSADDQGTPSITTLSNGNFVVVWANTNNGGIYAQLYNNSGIAQGSKLTIASGSFLQPSVTALANGKFAVVYANGMTSDILYKIVNSTANPVSIGNSITVEAYSQNAESSQTGGWDGYSSIGISSNTSGTEFNVSWNLNDWLTIKSAKFSDSGIKNGSTATLTAHGYYPSTAVLSNGNVVTVSGDSDTYSGFKISINSGTPSATIGDTYEAPSITALTGGGFVITWSKSDYSHVYAKVFNNSGTAVSGEIQVDTTGTAMSVPKVAATTDGGFVVVWTSNDLDGSGYAVEGRRFASTGTAVDTNEFQINEYRYGDQAYPVVTSLANATFATAWVDSATGKTTGSDIEVRVLMISPTLTTISTLTSGTEDTAYTISYATLAAAANETAADSFRIESVSSGTLTKNGNAVVAGTTLLSSGESLVWTPASNANGLATNAFTVKAWDSVAASASTTAIQVKVDVSAVNDAPAGTDKTVAANEDAIYNFSTTDFGFTDPNDNPANAFNRLKITTLPVAGTLNWDGAPVVAGNSYTASSIASKLTFTPAANANGTSYANFTFQVEDDGGVANSGVNLDASPNTLTINVTAVNDAPILSLMGANAYAATNNTPVSIFTSATTVSDIEGNYNGGTLVAKISANSQTNDKLAFTGSGISIASGNVTVDSVVIGTVTPTTGLTSSSSTMTVTFNANATSSLIEKLVEGLQFSTNALGSARTVSVTLTDSGTVNNSSGTQTAVVSSISNTAPTFNNDVTGTAGTMDSTLPINENATQTDISNLLAVTDVDSGQTLTWSISTAPTKGALSSFTSVTAISNGGTVTPSGLYYTPTSNAVGNDSFVIQISDGFGGTKTVTVPVTIANVLPVWGNSLLAGISENAVSFGVTVGTAATTQDTNGITYSITSGNTGSKFSINSSTGVITTLAALDYETTSQYVLTIRATDESSATSDATFTIPVLNVAEVPVNTVPSAKTTLEDTPLVITGLSVSDVDSASLTTILSVASGTGTLNVASGSGATVTNGNTDTVTIAGTLTQINAALAAVTYTPTANANGSSYATLTMKTYDGTSTAADLANSITSTVAINVTSVVDAPLVISGATTTAEDTQSSAISVAKAAVDVADITYFKVTDIANGTLYKNDGITPITNNSFITAAEAASVKFTPNADYNGTSSTIFNVQGSLNGSSVGSEAKTPVTMAVTAINDVPVISDLNGDTNTFVLGSAAQWLDVNDATQVIDIDSVNFDGGNLTITYSSGVANNGNFALDTSLGITSGDSNSSNGVIVAGETLYYDNSSSGAIAFGIVGDNTHDGQSGHPLVITFNANATPDVVGTAGSVVSLLAQYLSYSAPAVTGNRVFDVVITDGDGGTSATSTVTVTGINTAPVLTSGNTYTLTSTNEETNSSGTLVSAIVDTDFGYEDTDNDGTFTPTKGMAVTATTGTGTWQYSIDDGTTWTNFGSVSVSAALLLSATTQVRYVPDTHNSETANFTFRAWDTTDGSSASVNNTPSTVNTTTNGTSTPFSTNTATANIVVSSVNDAPSGTDKTITTNEDTAYTFTASDFGFNETIDNPANALNRVKITTLPNTGTLKLSGVAVSVGDFVSVANIANLTFTPATNDNGTERATFTFQVEDDGGTSNGGVNLATSANTITVNVTAIADTPSITDASAATNAQNATGLVVSRNTADGSEVTHFKITDITNGTLFQNDGTTSIVNGEFITFAQANAGLKFTPSSSTAGTFKLQASTSNAAVGLGGDIVTATITVGAGVASPTINEDTDSGAIAITGSDSFYKITAISNGTLYSDAAFTAAITSGSFIATSGATTNVYFRPTANYNGAAGFTIQGSTDNSSGLTGSPSVSAITITPVNDAPTVANALVDQSVNEDSALSYQFASNSFSDIDAGDTFTYTATKADGTALPSWLSFDATNRTFSGTPLNDDVGTLSVKVTATDSGLATVSDTFDIVIANVNDAPTATNLNTAETYTEDTVLNLTDVVVNDIDSANVTATLTLSDTGAGSFNTATSGAVTSTFSSGVWSAIGAKADVNILLAGVSFTPTLNFNSDFTVSTSISDGTAAAITDSKSFTGTAVNDAPTATNLSAAETYTEDTALNLTDIVISDIDSASVTATLTLSNMAAGSFNTATSNSVTSTFNAGVWSASGALADVNTLLAGVTFTPTLNFNSDFTISTSISDSIAAAITGSKSFTGTAVNDAPVFTAGANQSVLEDAGTQTITGFATSISKGATNESAQTLTFNVTNDNNSAFSTLPTINAAGDLTYKFADNFNGVVTVSATLSDNGGITNSGVDVSAPQTFTLTSTSVNDLPEISAITTTSTFTESGTGGTAVNLLGGTINVTDVDNTNFNGGHLSVSLNNYVMGDELAVAGGTTIGTISGGAGNDLTIAFNNTATPDAVKTLLGQITFANTTDDPTNKDTNPTRVATLVLNDSLGNSTPLTASITVTGQNDNPTVTLTNGNAIYSAQSPAITVDTGLTLADLDNTALNQATITLTALFNGNDETLDLTTSAQELASAKHLTITSYNSSTHQLVISGNAAISDYETVLHGVTYFNANNSPDMDMTNRTVSFSVRDSSNGDAISQNRTIFYDRPPTQIHDGGITVNQGATGIITTSLLEYTDTVTSPVTYTITTLPTHGSLFKNSVLLLANDTFTQSDIGSGYITYQHLGTAHAYVGATESDSFTFTSSVGRTNSFGTELKATGTFNITANLLNGAPVLTAAFPTLNHITPASGLFQLTTASVIDEDTVGDFTVSSILGSSIYDLDKDNASTQNTAGIAVFAADSVNGKWQYNLASTPSVWTDMVSLAESHALLLGSTDKIRFLPNGQNGVDTALSYYAWDRSGSTPPATGTYSDTTTRGGYTAFSVNAENVVLKVASVNDAPVIATGSHTLASTNEDTTSTAVSITTLLDGLSYHDVDTNALQGVAIIGTTGSGTWQFTTDNTIWTDMPANVLLSNNNALLLDKPNSVRFIPDSNWNGDAGLTLKAWDQTVGTPSLNSEPVTFNVGAYSAIGSFSENIATANLSVIAVNDVPTSIVPATTTDEPLTIQEDKTLTFNSANENALSVSDNIDTDQLAATDNLSATVSVLHGKLTVATNSGSTITNDNSNNVVITGSTAQINAALEGLVYAPLLNYNGADTLTLLTSDNGNTDHSDLAHPDSAITPLTVTKTVNLSVTAVNDAPIASGSSILAAILEDNTNPFGVSVSALFQANFSDSKDQLKPTGYSDANTFAGVGIIGYTPDNSAGSWQYQIDNGGWTTIESALSLSKALTLKITDNLRFVPVADYNGTPPALTVLLIDNSIDFVTSGVSSYARKDVGVLGGASPYSSGTVSLTTNIIPVNDDPSFTNGANQIVKEDTGEQTIANFISIFSKGPSNESYQNLTFTATNSNNTLFSIQPSINSSGTLTYTPAMNANGSTTVTVYLTDSENGTTATQTFTITVQPVNDAPTQIVPNAQSVDEDSSLTLSHFSVGDELDTKQAATDNLTTTLTVQHGKLTANTATGNDSNSISITGSAAQINAALNGLIYKPNANYNGKDSLTVLTSDNGNTGGGALSVSNTIEITVNPVNDAPVITSKETISSVAENSPLETVIYTVSATDIDAGQKLSYSLSGQDANSFAINATTGVVTLKAAANFEVKNSYQFNVVATDDDNKPLSDVKAITINVTDVDEVPVAVSDSYETNEDTTLKITATQGVLAKSSAADANSQLSAILVKNPANGTLILEKNGAFTYQPNPNYSGVDSFTYKANDGKLDSDLVLVSLTVQPVNDVPSFKIGENQKVPAIAGKQTVSAWASEINAGINETDQIVSFQVTNDNEALFSLQPTIDNTGKLTYTPAEGANGSATIRVFAKDNGGVTNGGVDTSAEQSAVIVIESITNTAPTLTSATTFELPEKITAITTITATDKDGDLLNYSLVGGANQDLFTLDSATGALSFKAPVLFDTKPTATNSYAVSVAVSDGKISDTQNLIINVLTDLDSDGKADKYDEDIDGDGILNIDEDKIPNPSGGNFGDANGDGILDSYQLNVGSIKTIANDKNGSPRYAAFSVADGLSIQNITNSVAKNLPKGTTLPLGAFGLTVGNVPIGGDATITMTVSPDVVMNGYLKQNNMGQWVKLLITLGGDTTKKTISFTLTDGGIFDKDGVANGKIVDPGGPTVLANVPVIAKFADVVQALTETDNVLTTSGKLIALNTEKFTVIAQNGMGLFGSFNIDGAGNWSYATDTAHNEFLKDKIYTDTFTVKTTDGVVSNVKINITGTRDLPLVINNFAKQTLESVSATQKLLHGQITLQTAQSIDIVQNTDKTWTNLDLLQVNFTLKNSVNVGTNLVKTTLANGSTLTLNTVDGSYIYTPNLSKTVTDVTDNFTVTADEVPLTLTFNHGDLLDRDGISDTVETTLADLANVGDVTTTKGDLNGDGIEDKNQGAVTNIAWRENKDFNAALNNTLADAKPIINIVVASDKSGSVDSASQLSNVSVLSGNSAFIGGGKPKTTATSGEIKTPWDALQFSVAANSDKGLKDVDATRDGTQTLIKIDISRAGESEFNGYMKYISAEAINAYKKAGLSLVTLDGEALTTEKQAGWYDYTQRISGGDGAHFLKDANGKITAIEIVITDNQFGDNDIASNQITDPSLPVIRAVPIDKTLESSTDVSELAAEFTNLTLQETLIDKEMTTTQLVDNPLACLPEWTLKLLNIPLKINQDVTTTIQIVAPLNGTGNTSANKIVGNSADNILNGLAGADTLTGGLGADTFVFGDKDVVTDFNVMQGDKIDVRASGATSFVTTFTKQVGQMRFDGNSQTLQIDTNGDGNSDVSLQLLGISNLLADAIITK